MRTLPVLMLALALASPAGAVTRRRKTTAAGDETAKKAPAKKKAVASLTLDEQPAVRRKRELRDGRFEFGASFGSTLGQPFRNTMLFGPRADYHINDWLSVGASLGFQVKTLDTSLTQDISDRDDYERNQICAAAHDPQTCDLTHTINRQDGADWKNALNSVAWKASLRGTVSPFSGKMALFSKVYLPYDFYGFLGLGIVGLKNGASDAALGNDGTRLGPDFGLGLHVFFNDWIAFSVEFADTVINNNPSGRNVNLLASTVDGMRKRVNEDDQSTSGLYTLTGGLSFYAPFEAHRSK